MFQNNPSAKPCLAICCLVFLSCLINSNDFTINCDNECGWKTGKNLYPLVLMYVCMIAYSMYHERLRTGTILSVFLLVVAHKLRDRPSFGSMWCLLSALSTPAWIFYP